MAGHLGPGQNNLKFECDGLAVGLNRDRSVIIDMVVMHMVQVAIMDIVHMIPVADHQVPVIGAVRVIRVRGLVHWRLAIRIGLADFKHMFINMITMDKMQMPIVEIVPVITVPDPLMPAAIAVHMRMILMNVGAVILWRNDTGAQPGNE